MIESSPFLMSSLKIFILLALLSVATAFPQNAAEFAKLSNNTDPNIDETNFCIDSGFAINDGTQKQNNTGFCSVTPQGQVPDIDHMVSTLILFPGSNENVKADTNFTVQVRTRGIQLGTFLDPKKFYYKRPQILNKNGFMIGHQHIACQQFDLGTVTPMDPNKLAFFKGMDTQPNTENDLFAVVSRPDKAGLAAGNYRCCTITGSESHQPGIMPVAKHGSLDDCVRFTVSNDKNAVSAPTNSVIASSKPNTVDTSGANPDAAAAAVQSSDPSAKASNATTVKTTPVAVPTLAVKGTVKLAVVNPSVSIAAAQTTSTGTPAAPVEEKCDINA